MICIIAYLARSLSVAKRIYTDTIKDRVCVIRLCVDDGLLDIENMAEARHIKNPFYKRLKVTDNKLSSLCCDIFIK